jgi:hypothetical protein
MAFGPPQRNWAWSSKSSSGGWCLLKIEDDDELITAEWWCVSHVGAKMDEAFGSTLERHRLSCEITHDRGCVFPIIHFSGKMVSHSFMTTASHSISVSERIDFHSQTVARKAHLYVHILKGQNPFVRPQFWSFMKCHPPLRSQSPNLTFPSSRFRDTTQTCIVGSPSQFLW